MRTITAGHLEQVATIYMTAAENGDQPTRAVREAFSAPTSTATRWVMNARKAGLLAPVRKGQSLRRNPSLIKIARELGVEPEALRAAILKAVPSGHIVIPQPKV